MDGSTTIPHRKYPRLNTNQEHRVADSPLPPKYRQKTPRINSKVNKTRLPPQPVPVAPVTGPATVPVAPVTGPATAPVAPVIGPQPVPVAPVTGPATVPVAPVTRPATAPVAPVTGPQVVPVAPVTRPATVPVAPVTGPVPVAPITGPQPVPIAPITGPATVPVALQPSVSIKPRKGKRGKPIDSNPVVPRRSKRLKNGDASGPSLTETATKELDPTPQFQPPQSPITPTSDPFSSQTRAESVSSVKIFIGPNPTNPKFKPKKRMTEGQPSIMAGEGPSKSPPESRPQNHHVGGSRSVYRHKEAMMAKKGPSFELMDVFDRFHSHKTKQGKVYVNKRAENTVKKYNSLKKKYGGQLPDETLWKLDADGEDRHGRLFGFGNKGRICKANKELEAMEASQIGPTRSTATSAEDANKSFTEAQVAKLVAAAVSAERRACVKDIATQEERHKAEMAEVKKQNEWNNKQIEELFRRVGSKPPVFGESSNGQHGGGDNNGGDNA